MIYDDDLLIRSINIIIFNVYFKKVLSIII